METMHLDAPARPRWFAGLRRSRSRMLGGVAGGFADFWLLDPMLLRVLLVSPMATGILSMMLLPWSENVLGWLAVGITQLLWVVSGLVAVGYVVAWLLIPQEDRASIARRFLALGGASGTAVKFAAVIGAFIVVAWLGLVLLALGVSVLEGVRGEAVGLLFLLGVAGLVALGVWVSRGGDLREAIVRFGSPGFGRADPRAATATANPTHDPRASRPAQTRVVGPEDDPTFVVSPDADPTTVLHRDVDPTAVLDRDADPTTVLDRDADPTTVLGPDGDPTVAYGRSDRGFAHGAADPTTAYAMEPGAVPPVWSMPTPPQDAVDRARAAATAEADARAAVAEAERRQRIAENRARRAAARAVRKERNRWGKLVAAVTLLTAGTLFLTDQLTMTTLGGLKIGVISLALLAGGIVVGAWFGSARWLIAPALLLAMVLGLGSLVSTTLDHAGSGTPISWAPKSLPPDQQTSMFWESGDVTVDLTDTRTLAGRVLYADVDRGSLTVVVPAGQWVTVSSRVGLGRNHLESGQIQLLTSDYRDINPPTDGNQTADPLFLNLGVAIGELNLIQKES